MDEKLSRYWEYRYLKKYYSYQDSMSIHGVSRMEIKHSDFLKWLLVPGNNPDLDDLALRKMLSLIQRKAAGILEYARFSKEDLENANYSYKGGVVEREKYNIDLLIKVWINDVPYVFVIENKIGAAVYNDLDKYYKRVKEENAGAQIIRVFLYYYCDTNDLEKVKNNKYIILEYQDVYDDVLKDTLKYAISSRTRNIIYDYIHCLASFTDAKNYYMITTDEEKELLGKLFRKEEVIDILKCIDNNKNISPMFEVMLAKYYKISGGKVNESIKRIVTGKKYFIDGGTFNNKSFNGIGELLKEMIEELLEHGVSLEELDRKLNYLYDNPIFIEEGLIDTTRNPGYYTTNIKTFEYNGVIYYVCSAWKSSEYIDLKNKINKCGLGFTLS